VWGTDEEIKLKILMESVLKCATLHKNFILFVSLRKEGFPERWKSVRHLGEVVEIIKVFLGDSFCLTVNS
jgi:hypothetical protein